MINSATGANMRSDPKADAQILSVIDNGALVEVLPETLADITADDWTLAVMMALFVLVLLAIVMIGKGPRRPTTHLGPA